MLRNIASQKWRVYAWDTTTGAAKTGDAANISAHIRIDDGSSAATNDTAPTEASSSNEPGYYDFDLTQAETNGAKLSLAPKSSTSNVAVIACPPVVYTRPQYFSLLGIASDGDLTKVNTLDGHTPQTGDSYAIVNDGTNGNAAIKTQVAAIETDTQDIQNRIPAALVGGRIDATVDGTGMEAGAVTAIQSGLATAANLATVAGYLDTEIAAILADTNELQTDWADGGRLDLILDARASQTSVNTIDGIVDDILVDTGTTLPATLSTIAGYIDTEIGTLTTELAKVPKSDGTATWNATALAAIQSEANDALVANHLDHLLAATYDPSSKPGAADALLNELVENDGGVARFTANALEQGPGGAGSDPWDTALPGAYAAGTAGYILGTNLDAPISGVGGATGSGADAVTINLKIGGINVADADVWITSDAGGTTVVAGTLQTDSNGNAQFLLDAGNTYYLWAQKDGANLPQGEQFTAVAD